jgi:hypothetical protein
MDTRHFAVIALVLGVVGCGGGGSISCQSNAEGSLNCRPVASRPESQEKVLVAVSASGQCYVTSTKVTCSGVGAELRRRFPGANPQIILCPDSRSDYEHTSAVMKSINDEAFPKFRFGASGVECANTEMPPNTSLERARDR